MQSKFIRKQIQTKIRYKSKNLSSRTTKSDKCEISGEH